MTRAEHAQRFYNPAATAAANSKGVSTADVASLDTIAQIVALQTAALPGYARALASSLRDGPLTGLEWAYTRAAGTGVRVLHIHVRFVLNLYRRVNDRDWQGDNDRVVAYKSTTERIAALLPQSKHVRLDGAGHDLCYDERYAGQVVDALDTFLRAE